MAGLSLRSPTDTPRALIVNTLTNWFGPDEQHCPAHCFAACRWEEPARNNTGQHLMQLTPHLNGVVSIILIIVTIPQLDGLLGNGHHCGAWDAQEHAEQVGALSGHVADQEVPAST